VQKKILDSVSPLLGFLATHLGMMRFRSAFFVLIPIDLCHRGRPHPLRLAVIILFFLLWLLPEDEIKRLPVDRRLGRGFWEYLAHAQWYAVCRPTPPDNHRTQWASTATISHGAVTLFSSFRSSDLSQSI